MSDTDLTLIFVNGTSHEGKISVYQADPSIENTGVVPWFQKSNQPTTRIAFTWNPEAYGFAWLETGHLADSITFQASQFWPANLSTTNAVSLKKTSDGYTFTDQTAGPQTGQLFISTESSVVSNEVLVGIGMAGAPTLFQHAEPDLQLIFTPDPQYWVQFSYEIENSSIIMQVASPLAQVIYPSGVTSMTAILKIDPQENLTWDIKPTNQVNMDFEEALKQDPNAVWGLHY